MSIKSEQVKKWRNNFKDRIIAAFGGACLICGYSKCPASLALHHLDPKEKDFVLGSIRANPVNWNVVVAEIRKCALLCHNCHSEVHYGVATITKPIVLDESILNYKETQKELRFDSCLCGGKKPVSHKFCSQKCSSKFHRKVDWDSMDLVELTKNKSIPALADELGISDRAIYKRFHKLGIPVPTKRK